MSTHHYWYFLKMGTDEYGMVDGVLVRPDGLYWQAVSGPKGKGALPDGVWRIGGVRRGGLNFHFRDGAGNFWVCGLYNEAIRITHGRWNFAIHPDGSGSLRRGWTGPDGTHGCIGLTEYDTSEACRSLVRARGNLLIARKESITDEQLMRIAA